MLNLNKTTTVGLNTSDSRLTGNIKINIDSNGKLYLNSIDSNNFISKNIYNKYKIDCEFSLDYALHQFLSQEHIPNLDYIYDSNNNDLFKYGCKTNTNLSFSEKFSFFAPIYIHPDKGIPDYFIIFKNNDINYKNSIIVKIFYLKKDEFYKIFNDDYVSNLPNTVWYKLTGTSNYYYFNGINYKYAIFGKSFKILKEDWDLNIFKNINLLSGNHFNLEFLFDDDSNDVTKFTGVYFFKDNTFKTIDLDLNVDMQNTILDYPINHENLYNLDEKKYILNTNYFYINNNINLTSNNDLYLLEDKLENGYIINEIKNNIVKLNTKNLNYYNLFGITNTNSKRYPAMCLQPGYQSIKLKLNRNKSYNLFYSGDYIELDCVGFDNFKFRVIASEESCCSPTDIGEIKNEKYFFQTDYITVNKYSNNINIVKIKCYNYFDVNIESGNDIKISCNLFNTTLTIDHINYNFNDEYFELIFIDYNNLFDNINGIGTILFEYTSKNYKYVKFNPYGSPSTVARRIVEAFRKFKLNHFDFTFINDFILIKSKYVGDIFKNCRLNIDISKSITPLSNFTINDKTINGINIYDNENKLILTKKYINCQLNGASNTYCSRIAINKIWMDKNLNGSEVFSTKQGLKKLKKYNFDNTIDNFKSIYIDSPEIGTNYIKNYKYINDFYVLTLNDDIFMLNDGYINCYNTFSPKIFKIINIDIENI